jgi:hypothetical protein
VNDVGATAAVTSSAEHCETTADFREAHRTFYLADRPVGGKRLAESGDNTRAGGAREALRVPHESAWGAAGVAGRGPSRGARDPLRVPHF